MPTVNRIDVVMDIQFSVRKSFLPYRLVGLLPLAVPAAEGALMRLLLDANLKSAWNFDATSNVK